MILNLKKDDDLSNNNSYDLIIIGGGPAGLSAAIYSGRARLNTLVVEELIVGGQSSTTETIENYPGFPDGIGGYELAQKMEEQAKRFGVKFLFEKVERTELDGKEKKVYIANKIYKAKSVIISSGASPRRLNVPGSEKFHGKGISYCATCDGALFADKKVIIVGGGNSAVEEGLFMMRFTKDITFVQDLPYLTAEKILQERLLQNSDIKIYYNSEILSINGEERIESMSVKDKNSGEKFDIKTDGIFVYIGLVPKTDFLDSKVELNEYGYIRVDKDLKTNLEGVFAAGDVIEKSFRQVITAAADGALAAKSAEKYLENLKEV
ncbi:MAG: Thioredoxin reductase [candidate division TA06 bacterium 32_111]|uniref:Thioredoxin reductase n=2 Tax=Bacteria candidate phyla TaxID=1783234 RepID=A0A101I348_UNCT6|nr:MAG: Thioredoxin reductase [candidate division TA06 bacterium 32_111]KUK87015.1 MAG: Thioredoxin reductase [candidate division TA06 bacterium 34_109]HAF07636.1 thioredoxin-disulfide reductase [candidate division WOR-3 bacterium]HCP17231.1 thioredoxin-disulfide reductase [candidate division WOR-3 bacterium]